MFAKLIIALDFSSEKEALELIQKINPQLCALKVGSELFTLLGPDFVRMLVKQGYRVFLDLKFHDIPNTVAHACRSAAELGVWMVNVHASGGLTMMQAAKEALDTYGLHRPLLTAVTVLTSMDSSSLPTPGINSSVDEQVTRLAKLTEQAGLDGIVCSAHEVPMIKSLCAPSFLTVTPGIRLADDAVDDQSRVMTPQQAIKLGSDYLVMGRSITRAPDPVSVIHSILNLN